VRSNALATKHYLSKKPMQASPARPLAGKTGN